MMTAGVGKERSLGLWLIGARGSLGTTTTIGLCSLASRLVQPVGCVSEHPDIDARGLVSWDQIVIGGHDLTETPLAKRAERLVAGGVVPHHLVDTLRDELHTVDGRIRAGLVAGMPDQRAEISRVSADITTFAEQVDDVVVVDVSSTEAVHDAGADADSWAGLEQAWDAGRAPLAPSSAYAAAAIQAGAAYVGFTPSTGIEVPALHELARCHGLPWAGCDGKTGETLVKSALAPMFSSRALAVRSWTSVNLLGGGDGATLADPGAAASKTATKRSGLEAMLGHSVEGPMHIDFVDDLGDWKTAWDQVRFDGFLGARMTMQFTWQGCDSALAAPLVLDLARLLGRARSLGDAGVQGALGFFFKQPLGLDEHRLAQQWELLRAWSVDGGRRAAARPAG